MNILEVAKYVGAIVTIAGAIAPMIKILWQIYKKVQTIERHSHEDYKNILRLIIMNEDMPISERIAAGDKYIEEGGNGAVKAKYKALIKEYEETEINGYNNI